jgi:alkyldihydroxyacetonephosphate synthase
MERTNGRVNLVLAPSHRSFLDFIILSYLFFSLPELQIDLPFIVAASEFELLPVIGWIATLLRAFYVHRGRDCIDRTLPERLRKLKDRYPNACIEVFVEGKRSRDRRFVEPKTGLLKSLKQSGNAYVVLPIAISYEKVPEQDILSEEAAGSTRRNLSLGGTIAWLIKALKGEVKIGNVHIAAGDPLSMNCQDDTDYKEFVHSIQLQQQKEVVISQYHVRAAAKLFNLDSVVVNEAFTNLGCKFWPESNMSDKTLPLPTDSSSILSIVLQIAHALSPLFVHDRRQWSEWLNPSSKMSSSDLISTDTSTRLLYEALKEYFDSADAIVDQALTTLKNNGFDSPNVDHVFQTCLSLNSQNIPLPIVYAAVSMKVTHSNENGTVSLLVAIREQSIDETSEGRERLGFWGFSDSGFIARMDNHNRYYVTMKGSRYGLCGKRMTKLLPFMESALQVKIDLSKEFCPFSSTCFDDDDDDDDDAGWDFSTSAQHYLHNIFKDRVSFTVRDRARHGTGHSQEDVFSLRSGDKIRIPDAVVWPSSEEDVIALVEAAQSSGWCLIPFGGGTNVTGAIRCPSKQIEPRPIISVDMTLMNTILWLNEENGLAHIQAGISGSELSEKLERRGYTMGHEPDSIEFSTLGGWIATKASGMKRSKYGNIEDIVMSTRVVGPNGILWKGSDSDQVVAGRVSEGIDVRSLALGSEGCFGIITSAVIRVWPVAEVKEYDSVIFPRFEDGLHFMKALSRERSLMPACARLLDNAHFRLGQALRPDATSWIQTIRETAQKLFMTTVLSESFDPESVVCATICYEGSKTDIENQMKFIQQLAKIHGGFMLGSPIGKAGYDLTYMIAYLRDFAMTYHILGESFETFVPWSRIESLIEATKTRIVKEHTKRLLPGVPFVGCRVTQLYHEGACLYFYLCISFDGVKNPSTVFVELEHAARDEILKHGGSLSHHHGLGKHRSSFVNERCSTGFQSVVSSIKESIDKDNIFGARNGLFAKY